jgi:hypothetical protein
MGPLVGSGSTHRLRKVGDGAPALQASWPEKLLEKGDWAFGLDPRVNPDEMVLVSLFNRSQRL